jgi:hypothetical protein
MAYTQRVDRHNPSCIIFLVDQSQSMSDQIGGAAVSKATAVADQINGTLFELVQRCSKSHDEPPRRYFGVSVIGYDTDSSGTPLVGSIFGGDLAGWEMAWTTDLALHPLRIEERTRVQEDGQTVSYRSPIWVDPRAGFGTPMCAALNLAGRTVKGWIDQYPNSFPPIVVNLTDGESTDGDPTVWAERIQRLATSDGQTLLFNIGVSSDGRQPLMFPSDKSQVSGRYGQTLFEMSSPLPPMMLEAASRQGYPVTAGARGFGLDADMRAVMTFLNIGTSVGHLLR